MHYLQESSAQLSYVWGDQSGQNLIEYALMGCLIAVAAISSMMGYATSLKAAFNWIGHELTSAIA